MMRKRGCLISFLAFIVIGCAVLLLPDWPSDSEDPLIAGAYENKQRFISDWRRITDTIESPNIDAAKGTRTFEKSHEEGPTRAIEGVAGIVVAELGDTTRKPPNVIDRGTRENPIPVGIPGTIFYDGEPEFDLTVVKVVRGDEALQQIKTANPHNYDPPEGFEFVLIFAEVAYAGADERVLGIDKSIASSVTNGRIISYLDTYLYSPCCIEPDFDMQLLPGGTGEGWLALPVALEDDDPLLLIGDTKGVYYSLTP